LFASQLANKKAAEDRSKRGAQQQKYKKAGLRSAVTAAALDVEDSCQDRENDQHSCHTEKSAEGSSQRNPYSASRSTQKGYDKTDDSSANKRDPQYQRQ